MCLTEIPGLKKKKKNVVQTLPVVYPSIYTVHKLWMCFFFYCLNCTCKRSYGKLSIFNKIKMTYIILQNGNATKPK